MISGIVSADAPAVRHLDGLPHRHAQGHLWGSERDLRGEAGLATRLYRWLANEVWINAFAVGADAELRVAQQIREAHPTQVLAYVDSLFHLARAVEPTALAGLPAPHAIICSAGTLHPQMRTAIESVFEAPVYNRYGSREAGDIACECRRTWVCM